MEPPPSAIPLPGKQRSNLIQGLAGAGAGVIAAALVNPLDMVKIRLQNNQKPVGALKAPGTLRILSQIRAEEGLSGLFRGFSATTIAYTIDRAIWFPVYSFLKERISYELRTFS
jgi:solute carrier family 25 folate transporter 32